MSNSDYSKREYLSVVEVSSYTGMDVASIHKGIRAGEISAKKSTSGQFRIKLDDIEHLQKDEGSSVQFSTSLKNRGYTHRIVNGNAQNMDEIATDSVHLAITSPPYFNAKMYSQECNDLGNVHDLDEWLHAIGLVWREVYRVLSPGRKFFLNIMNLPVRTDKTFRTLNLVGKNIDLCESLGFIFKRDIVWQKTNGVRAHFGTYPYPGGILLNHMHEFILEFEKPMLRPMKKYAHVSPEQREESKLDKEFWVELKKSDVWVMKPEKSGNRRIHASPFPLELPSRLIRAYSFVGEVILDPFLGSGTTALAASQYKRNSIGYEINSEFCEMVAYRLSQEFDGRNDTLI